ncbi:MAG: heme anaerobic degradation radical SAM methyltransferase ChuW/HutW [Deltaproteobacteria bacterium]|jgi:oxygen-independent coproporphyrinogen-3 oxidase|nr:heme anaerobic degradation radical SAM methyltransferase ChuW/HutW [Deltaproteobacteria bacterium]
MEWTPEAKESLKKAPPFVRNMAQKGVEAYAKKKGMVTVTQEIFEEAKDALMGMGGKDNNKKSDLNVGYNRRQTMHLTDEQRFLANETDDPLHGAFDRKMAVHAMPKNDPMPADQLQELWSEVMSDKTRGQGVSNIYVHIPFCQGHCLFCPFYQNAYKADLAKRYTDALIREMEFTARKPFVKSGPFHTVYFGGGTPTALDASDISRLVSTVKKLYPLTNDCEITFEGRFFNFSKDKIEAALEAGVNRFSLGVQTFDSQIRKSIGRKESKEKLVETLTLIREIGKASIIIDLIYGLPGQTLKMWEQDINTYLSLHIDGCDFYQLNVFSGGALERSVSKKALPKPATLREQADYFVRGIEMMEAAHQRRLSIAHWANNPRERNLYNIFSRGRSACLPLGSGAGGWLGNHMFFLEGDLKDYFAAVKANRKPVAMGLKGSNNNLLLKDISFQIELGYCDLKTLSLRHNLDILSKVGPVISQWEKVGLIRITNGCIYLTRPGEYWAVNLAQVLIYCLQS